MNKHQHLNINSPSHKVALSFPKGVTKQAHKDECDINQIMAKYQKTGLIQHINENEAQYGDISGDSFQDSMLIIAQANSMFEELPSSVRKNFDNDPGKFLRFVENPDNEGKLVEMGIANQREAIAPIDPIPESTTDKATPTTQEANPDGGE